MRGAGRGRGSNHPQPPSMTNKVSHSTVVLTFPASLLSSPWYFFLHQHCLCLSFTWCSALLDLFLSARLILLRNTAIAPRECDIKDRMNFSLKDLESELKGQQESQKTCWWDTLQLCSLCLEIFSKQGLENVLTSQSEATALDRTVPKSTPSKSEHHSATSSSRSEYSTADSVGALAAWFAIEQSNK